MCRRAASVPLMVYYAECCTVGARAVCRTALCPVPLCLCASVPLCLCAVSSGPLLKHTTTPTATATATATASPDSPPSSPTAPRLLARCCLRTCPPLSSTPTTAALHVFGRARPLHVRLRRAGRHCHCLEKQPSTRTHNTPSHGLTHARVAHGRRGCRLPMQGLRRGMHRLRRIVHTARLLTRPVAQILEEGKAFELGMYLKCPPNRINAFL